MKNLYQNDDQAKLLGCSTTIAAKVTKVHKIQIQMFYDEEEDSEESVPEEKDCPEFVAVPLSDICKVVDCAICIGILQNTRIVMACSHRFCKECIDKAMRLGRKEECPCRMHMPSRRAARDDPAYDSLIKLLFKKTGNKDFKEQELSLDEEEKLIFRQTRAYIDHIVRQQPEALVTESLLDEDSAGSLCSGCSSSSTELDDDYESQNNLRWNKLTPSTNELGREMKQGSRKRRKRAQFSQPSSVNIDEGCTEINLKESKESQVKSPGTVRNTEKLAWGGGHVRNHTQHQQHGSVNCTSSDDQTAGGSGPHSYTNLADSIQALKESRDGEGQ